MEGFFNKKETTSKKVHKGKALTCTSCGRYKNCDTPRIKPVGLFEKGIMNILMMPDNLEDQKGRGYMGSYARYLKQAYSKLGIDLERDCLNTYSVTCNGENPTADHVANHRRHITQLIEEYKPKVIVAFGDKALLSLIGLRWNKDFGSILKWRGHQIPDQDLKAWLCPVLLPFLPIDPDNPIEDVFFHKDLKKAMGKLDVDFPIAEEPEIIYLDNDLSILDSIQSGRIAFDYEGTGIKPQKKGHKIVSASVAVSSTKAYTFLMPKSRKARKPFTDLLQRKEVGKIAQNMKFEDTWTLDRLKVEVKGWLFDTMLAAHIVDNRTGVTGLKFQTYVQLGVIDYDEEIYPYLASSGEEEGANAINRIEELLETPEKTKKLLKYGAYDSIYAYQLADRLIKPMLGTQGQTEISPLHSDYPNAYRLLHDGTFALARAERQGFRIDVEYCERKSKKLTKQIERIEQKLFATKFYRHWSHSRGGNINLNSGTQLGEFLYGVKKIKPKKYTAKSKKGKGERKGSTDKEALKMLNIPELDFIIKRAELLDMRDTYLKAFMKEQVRGFLHPFYNLNMARTYRSSSSNPNFQNLPIRDPDMMKTVRKAVHPRIGHQLLEIDFSGVEVAIGSCFHKDPQMIKYITDSSTDMHGDMSKLIFKIDDFDKSQKDHGTLRSCVKNSFVFPQFYGSYYKNCAINICGNWMTLPEARWKKSDGYVMKDDTTIAEHMINNGIKSFDEFVQHLRVIEKDFWGRRFKVYDRWKTSHYNAYLKEGYISLKTGFTCGGIMSKNDTSNYPIQGSAFHCLLWCFIQIDKQLTKLGLNTKLIGQIHDSVILDIYPPELKQVYDLVMKIGTKELPKAFPWINVPLEMEADLCPVDGSWADKEGWNPDEL